MIKQPCWIDSNNVPHVKREECQKADLAILLALDSANAECSAIIDRIMDGADAVVNILTMREESRPRARGQKKPRKAKGQSTLPLIPEASDGKAA